MPGCSLVECLGHSFIVIICDIHTTVSIRQCLKLQGGKTFCLYVIKSMIYINTCVLLSGHQEEAGGHREEACCSVRHATSLQGKSQYSPPDFLVNWLSHTH